jgi:hypothetical protein
MKVFYVVALQKLKWTEPEVVHLPPLSAEVKDE